MANEIDLVVIIKTGKHSWKPPRGMREAFHEVLSACGVCGNREILMGDIIRGANGAKKVEVGNFDPNTKCILFYSQPGPKNRRHECKMIMPSEFRDNFAEFLNRLYKATGDKRYVEPEPVLQSEPPTYDFNKKGKGELMEKKTRRKAATRALKDETILILILEHIDELFKKKTAVTNGMILAAIRDLDPGYKPRSVYLVLLDDGYIFESDRTPKTAKVSLTEKSRELLAKHAPAPKEKTGIDIEAESKRLREAFDNYQGAMAELTENGRERQRLAERSTELGERANELISLIERFEKDAKLFQRLQVLYNPAS